MSHVTVNLYQLRSEIDSFTPPPTISAITSSLFTSSSLFVATPPTSSKPVASASHYTATTPTVQDPSPIIKAAASNNTPAPSSINPTASTSSFDQSSLPLAKTATNDISDTGRTLGTQLDTVGPGLLVEGSGTVAVTQNDKVRPGRKRKDGTALSKMRVTDSKTPRYVLNIF